MLSYKMDFSSCDIMPGFGKSSHIYAAALDLFMQQHCLCSIIILIYAATSYLFMQQYYTYIHSSIAYAVVSIYAALSIVLIYTAALLMQQYQLMQHLAIYAALYLFTQHYYTYFIVLIHAKAMLMQQYCTNLCSSVTVALLCLFHYVFM